MRKLVISILLVSVGLSLGSCSSFTENSHQVPSNTESNVQIPNSELSLTYEVLEVGDFDYISSAQHSSEISWEHEKIDDESLHGMTMPYEVYVYGNKYEYQLSYSGTKTAYWFNSTCDIFQYSSSDNANIQVCVEINRNTGRVDWYSWYDRNYLSTFKGEIKNEDECLKIASEHLGDFVDDPEAYTLDESKYLKIPEFEAVYSFEFVRMNGNLRTFDQATIDVTVYGDVIIHSFFCLGEMKDIQIPVTVDMDAVQGAINSKIDTIYANIIDRYEVESQTSRVSLIKLADGRLAYDYYVEVSLSPFDESAMSINELTHIIVCIG